MQKLHVVRCEGPAPIAGYVQPEDGSWMLIVPSDELSPPMLLHRNGRTLTTGGALGVDESRFVTQL